MEGVDARKYTELRILISVTINKFDVVDQSYTVISKILQQISLGQFSFLCSQFSWFKSSSLRG